MTHDESLLQTIIANSDDDGPRLVYADWLEEHGHPERAEFIRVQCELAKLSEGDMRRPELQTRERALLKEHEEEWTAPLRDLVDGWGFRRGFIEEVTFFREPSEDQLQAVARCTPVRDIIVIVVGGGGGE